jgi:putative ABC transport system ATP-binding protein
VSGAAAGGAPDARAPVVRLVRVTRSHGEGAQRVAALDDLSLDIAAGEWTAVVGPSGSGKSTLLNLVAGIDVPTSGEVWVDGRELSKLSDDDLTRHRRDRIGVVYQFFNLLPTLSVRENVALPALLAGAAESEVLARADRLIESVGLSGRSRARPATLSGGEMQRVAIARALIHEPPLVLADEPTGNLDSRAGHAVLERLRDLTRERGTTVVLVTHSAAAAALADRVIELHDGRLASDRRNP